MLRTLLTLTSLMSLAVLGGAATASAEPIFAVDIIAKHDVAWDYREGDTSNNCDSWSKGSGTESLQIHSKRREKMRLERVFGRTLLTSAQSGTFDGLITRNGSWKVNVPPNQPPCSPCGPNSEYGPCTDPVPPTPLQFSCGSKDVRSPIVTIGYEGSGIPSISKGIRVKAFFQPDDYFPKCPPNLPRGMRGPTFKTPKPDWEKVPASDLARLTRLKDGDSLVVEVKRQRAYVEQDGKVHRGDSCVHAPDLKRGYSECAVTEYSVTFTRLS
jgi:hypothetical protein